MNTNYSYRKSAIEKPQHWELADEGIIFCQERRKELHIPYENVQSIRLLFLANNRYRPNSYGCRISIGQADFDIHSYNYEGFADFREQTEQYVPFVKELVRRVKSANPDCILLTGKTPAAYYGGIAIMVVALLLLVWILIITSDSLDSISAETIFSIFVKLLIVGFLGIYAIRSIKVNRPKKIKRNEIPDYILPEVPGPDPNEEPQTKPSHP